MPIPKGYSLGVLDYLMSNVPLHFNHVEEVSPKPIQLTLDELMEGYLMASLTDREKAGIQSTVNQDRMTVLTLPANFNWVPVQQASPGLYRHAFLASEANGPKRIHLVFNKQEIVEVKVLNP